MSYYMMNRYKSDYPNQVHQLSVYISKNYYLLKSGEIKYQNKKFDINWKNYVKTGKRHLVSFVIRDHCSGCFYAETHPIDQLPHLKEFLFNAWRKKDHYEFYGIPENLIVGRNVVDMWPELMSFADDCKKINIELAESGFSTAVRATKDWENNINYYTIYPKYKTIEGFQSNNEIICRDLNFRKRSDKEESNLEKWAKNPKGASLINEDKERFYKSFK